MVSTSRLAIAIPMAAAFSFVVQAIDAPIHFSDSLMWGVNIQRTMKRIASGQPVKIVFTGQSVIDANNTWPSQLVDNLRTSYPGSAITTNNEAQGACDAGCLLPQMSARLSDEHADLVMLYVYGWEQPYEQLVDAIKQYAGDSVEVLFLNNHVDNQGTLHDKIYGEYWSHYFLPELAERRSLGFADIHNPWVQYLKDFGKAPTDFLADSVHLKQPEGQDLMRMLVRPNFTVRGSDTRGPQIDSILAPSPTRLIVFFNERLDSLTASTAANYQINGASVSGAFRDGFRRWVWLNTSPRPAGAYTLTVANVADIAGNPVATGTVKSFTQPAPVEWSTKDIGFCGTPGVLTHSAGSNQFTLKSGEDGINQWKNEFFYVYQSAYGDCEIKVKIESMSTNLSGGSPIENTIGGLMIRETDQWSSKFAMFSLCDGSDKMQFSYRNALKGYITQNPAKPGKSAPRWLKLTRSDATITGYESTDGTTWTIVGATIVPMAAEVTIGMLAVGGKYNLTNTVQFSNVTVDAGAAGVARGSIPVNLRGDLVVRATAQGLVIDQMNQGEKTLSLVTLDGRTIFKQTTLGNRVLIPLNLSGKAFGIILVKYAGSMATRAYPFAR